MDLTPYKTQAALRLRFQVNDYWGAGGDEDLFLDDIAIEESPAAVTLGPADPVTTTTAQLTWTKYAPADFKEYLVYRGTSPGITNANGALIRTAADPNATQWLDTNLQLRRTYYYRVYVKNQHDTVTGSNEVSATTLGVTMGTVEDFESGSGSWTLSGGWTRMAGVGRSGGYALVDSAGDYPNSSDTLPLTATLGVDLTTAVWPVLTFWDHGAFQLNADWGVVEISTNQGAGWSTRRYAVTGIRNTWRENKIDLSEWKGNGSVWIRFRTTTDGGVPADGWYLDDVVVAENAHGPLGYPYVNGFESGMGDLLSSQWTQSGENPREGATLLVSNSGQRLYPSAEEFVYLAGALDLRAMTAPSLVYWVRGHMYCCTQFTAQVSTNGGLTWANVGPFLQNDWAQENTWIRHQVDLTPYIAQAALRIRFKLNDYWGAGGDANLYLDGLRIGEPAPSAPTPTAPANGSTVPVFRPTLTVANAYDVQWDNLTYRFEIYSDEAMTQLVAQVPSVAETAATTSWAVDTDLLNNHQYWWRCRASDGTNIGPWSATATFYVVQVNNPPTVPQIVSPSNGTSLWGTDAPLIWYPSTDPNVGDSVTYDLQIDNDPAFGSPEVNETGIDESHGIVPQPESTTITVTLGALGGYGNLQNFTVYYWRLRAVDNRGAASSWTSESRYFLFGNDTQAPAVSWAAPTDGATLTASPVTFSGTASDDFAGLDYIQWSVDGGASWQLAAGAGSWNFSYAPTQNGDLEVLVRAADKAGNLSTPLSRNYAVALPDIPLNLRAWPDNSAVLLTWQAPALAGASGYHVYRSITSRSGYTKVTVTPVTEFTFTDTGLTNGTPYYYAARAVYAGEEKGYSDEAWAVPMASGRPPFVGDLMVSRSGDDLVLTWNPLTVDTGGGAYACPDYEVYTGNALTFVPDILGNANRLAIVGTEATYTAIGAAVDGQTYYIHVTAADALGNEGLWTQWRREENGQEASASPDWTAIPDPAASGGGYLTSATMDGAVTLTFSGTAVSLSALMGPDQGIAAVTIDGIPFGMLDLYSAGVQWRGWVFHADGLSDGPHTLVYEVVGTKNGASSGVDVNLDGYLFGRR